MVRTDKRVAPARNQVELIEMPFTVITCADMLLVNLERVGFNLRNFDMTIVFKVRSAHQAHIVQHFPIPCKSI